uniref:Uncharacterized protein n=1 Tax=Lotharella globosa TaxID=91324 RepID=A0A7S3Z1D1_9EUKA
MAASTTLILHYNGSVHRLKVFRQTPASDIEFNIRSLLQIPNKKKTVPNTATNRRLRWRCNTSQTALKYTDLHGSPLALTSFAPDKTHYLVVPGPRRDPDHKPSAPSSSSSSSLRIPITSGRYSYICMHKCTSIYVHVRVYVCASVLHCTCTCT